MLLSSLPFFNDTATTEIYTLSLHDALPISPRLDGPGGQAQGQGRRQRGGALLLEQAVGEDHRPAERSEEHTSELQSRQYLVCRLLLEKKKVADEVLRRPARHFRLDVALVQC